MKAKVFYTALNDISWENGPEEVIRFARSHKKSLAAKSEDGKNLIQVLMYLDEDKADVDKAIVDIIEFMSRDAINLAGDDHETAVHTAVRLGRTKVYRKLLERHADVSVKDRKRRVVLHEAAYAGNVDAIERLLSEDESLTRAQDHEGLTPLDMACWQGKVDAARLLAERDPQPLNMTDSEDRSPLFTAVEHGHEEIVRELARYKPILDKGDKDGQKPLDWACLENKLNLATILLDAEADVNCLDHDGYTPLITACAQGHLDIVKLLLARNANVKIQAFDGDSVLVRASRFGHVEVIDHLIAREDGKELIDVRNDKGETPLLIACRFGFGPTASSLLKAGADRMQPSHEGWAPILEACKWRYTSIVHMLLLSKEHGVTDDIRMALLEQRNEKGSNFTALHYACYYGHVEVARLLLRNDASADITDSKGRTPLHNASRQGYLEVVELVCEQTSDLNVVDELGWNALHHASWDKFNDEDQLRHDELGHDVLLDDPGSDSVPGKHAEIIQLLIRKGVKPWTTTDKGKTALHLAAKRGHFSRISHILGAVNRMSDLHMRDSKGKTALGSAMQHQRSQVVFQLLYWMETADFGEMQDKQELMLWLANREETHDLVSLALKKDVDNVFSPPAGANTDKWTALEWAACRGYPKLLWRLLFSTQPSPERDRRIKDAERIATEFAARRKDKGGEPGHQQRTYNKHGRNEKNLDNSATVGAAMARLDHFKILNVLRNPPMTQTAGQKQQLNQLHDKPTYSPNSLDLISTYTAELVDFYSFENQSGFLRRCASVKDVIYVRGPAQIMGEARERTHKLDALYGPDNGLAVSEWDEDDVDVRWIHLPANNMKWMKDLAQTVAASSDIDVSSLSWLGRSWDEVLGKNPVSRFMKPKCVYRLEAENEEENDDNKDEKKEDEEDDEPGDDDDDDDEWQVIKDDDTEDEEEEIDESQIAVYMPFLSLAKYKRDIEAMGLASTLMLAEDADNIVHGPRTLDEFYYHSCEEKNLREDILRRNEDQILSKTIHGSLADLQSWVLINVDQLWIWVLDEKTIITSTTHKSGRGEDTLLNAVFDALGRTNERSTTHRGPTDTLKMTRLIIDVCTGFFDREFEMDIGDGSDDLWKGSIHDIFTSALAQAALREAVLYDEFAAYERSSKVERSIQPEASYKRSEVLEAANLFREVKDIRDELHMLRAITEYQKSVQEDAPWFAASSKELTAQSIIETLRDMDKAAERIETAANTTLTLGQNEISIAQAQEAVSQGRTLMLFTVVTILFLPLSFFTSFFALDVAAFQKTPTWAFLLIFCVSFAIFVPLAAYAFFADKVTFLYYRLVAGRHEDDDASSIVSSASIRKGIATQPTFRTNTTYTRTVTGLSYDRGSKERVAKKK